LDDALAAYQALLETGVDPRAVAVAGDSAGGGLALALLHRLKDEALPQPGAIALLSPWADLTCTNPSLDANDEVDDMLTAAALRDAAALYAGTTPLDDPLVSPALGDLSGLPPMIVTVDESETLFDDARLLVERATEAGTPCELHRTTGLFHVWPVAVPFLPESRATVAQVVAFLDRVLAA
jgi:acetyl esterase/lipase